jgi:hypothetical protein
MNRAKNQPCTIEYGSQLVPSRVRKPPTARSVGSPGTPGGKYLKRWRLRLANRVLCLVFHEFADIVHLIQVRDPLSAAEKPSTIWPTCHSARHKDRATALSRLTEPVSNASFPGPAGGDLPIFGLHCRRSLDYGSCNASKY